LGVLARQPVFDNRCRNNAKNDGDRERSNPFLIDIRNPPNGYVPRFFSGMVKV
jgi:hypothetical protein